MVESGGEPGAVRAGAAFARRRQEKGISQGEIARNKIITKANLINFEKGRTWPREKTRARLEEAVDWPPGELARLHAGAKRFNTTRSAPVSQKVSQTDSDAAGVVSEAVAYAVSQVMVAADNLPPPSDPAFGDRVGVVLADVRALETIVTRAVRSTRGDSDVLRALTTVRDRYGQLMALAASAPSATLGQRLYAARTGTALSVTDVAAAVDVTPEAVEAAEAEQFVSDENRRRFEAFIAGLTNE
jgi:DNA-binding XRE family transcriptional regulator